MKGLLLKDFYVVTKQLKIFLIIIPIIAIFNPVMTPLVSLMGAFLPMTALAYDEQSKWSNLADMMPYSKSDIVISKYVFGYICMLGFTAIILLFRLISINSIFSSLPTNIPISLAIALIFIAINTPVMFKFGVEKGRFVYILAMAVLASIGALSSEININIFGISPIILILIAIGINIISMIISIRIQENK